MARESQGGTSERAKRTSLLTKTALHADGGGDGSARVRNLSEKGLGGVATVALKPGQRMTIMLSGIGPVQGRVAWVNGKSFGMEFEEPIDLDRLHMPTGEIVQAPQKFSVAPRFRPMENYKRPGFTHRR
ncbi:MAG: PilZ domain-containing protein [Pseudomonadota bacterium]